MAMLSFNTCGKFRVVNVIDDYIRLDDLQQTTSYFKDSNGFETWLTYDSNGNEIYSIDSDGDEAWMEYDADRNEIYYKSSNGYEQWQEYDENGNKIHFKDSNGVETWYASDGTKITKYTSVVPHDIG